MSRGYTEFYNPILTENVGYNQSDTLLKTLDTPSPWSPYQSDAHAQYLQETNDNVRKFVDNYRQQLQTPTRRSDGHRGADESSGIREGMSGQDHSLSTLAKLALPAVAVKAGLACDGEVVTYLVQIQLMMFAVIIGLLILILTKITSAGSSNIYYVTEQSAQGRV